MQKICLVEDSTDLQALITKELKEWFHVSCAGSLSEAHKLIQKEKFDLFLLDVNLPDGSGFEFCMKLRNSAQIKDVPVIFLTGKSDPMDKVMGFSIGADDYIVKPFESLELRARIKARMRDRMQTSKVNDISVFADLKFDRVKQRVFAIETAGDVDLNLTPFEFKLLYFLASKQGEFFNKTTLLKGVLEPNIHVNEQNVYTHISAIRRKLAHREKYLDCLPRIGYRFLISSEEIGQHPGRDT